MSDGKPEGGRPPEPKQDAKMNAQEAPKQAKGGLNPEIQARIGHQLRAIYDDVVRQGVPDRFAELIRKLDSPDAAAAMQKSSNPEGSE